MRAVRLKLAMAIAATMAVTAPAAGAPAEDAVAFTVPEVDDVPDLYGDVVDPDLVIFWGGNQFMTVPAILEAFKRENPAVRRIFVETLPPGILEQQLERGALVVGNLRIDLKPDLFLAGKSRIERMQSERQLFADIQPYAVNRLALLVQAGNPRSVRNIEDLGRSDLRVAMPNPSIEGIGRRVEEVYRRVGGEALHRRVMQEKAREGTTFLTQIHHRQTPARLSTDKSDVGPVWITEALFHVQAGLPVQIVELPDSLTEAAVSVAATLRAAPHPGATRAFMQFLTGTRAKEIFASYGFTPAP